MQEKKNMKANIIKLILMKTQANMTAEARNAKVIHQMNLGLLSIQ